jgi:hypothetical protein
MTAQRPEYSRPYPGHDATHTGHIDVNPPVSIADPHLLDGDLLSPTDHDWKHLAECAWCRQRQQAAERHHDDFSDDEFLRAARERAESGGAAAMADVTRLTPQLHTLVQEVFVREDVAVGQLWRLRWDNTTELAVVLDIDQWWVTVAPATTELAAADEFSALLPPTASQLNTDLAICFSLECVVPLFVFDRLIAPASRPTLDHQRAQAQLPPPDTLRDVWRAWRRSSSVPPALAYGVALDDGDFDRRELRSVIAASFSALVGASSCVPGDPLGETTPLAERITGTGLKLSELTTTTGLDRELFLRIKQGGRVSHREAECLAGLLDTDVQSVLNGNPPLADDLIVAVSRPRHRSALRRLAQNDTADEYRTEDGQRWHMAAVIEPSAARAAAGQTVTDARTHWDIKVDNYLQQRLSAIDKPQGQA